MSGAPRDRARPPRARVELATPAVEVRRDPDGVTWVRCPAPLPPEAPHAAAWLARGAEEHPDRVLFAERAGEGWGKVTWGEAWRWAQAIGAALLEVGLGPERPVLALSGNSLHLGLLTLGAYLAGVPIAPISPAYSLLSADHGKVRLIADLVRPGAVFVQDPGPYAAALAATGLGPDRVLTPATLDAVRGGEGSPALDQALAALGPDTVAKLLFTSGSTGRPKGVIHTHRMLTSNQAMLAWCWPFVRRDPPVLVDWLPWHHTFGGNHDLHLVLARGGSLYVDDGKPTPELIGRTVDNLRRVAPTVYFNVPAGYRALLPHLEQDADLRATWLSRLQVVFYAGAALSQDLWDRLVAVLAEADREVLLTSAWGATETAPLATSTHWYAERSGIIGLPAPGVELALVPSGRRTEVRVRGPHVTPGYLGQPELTAAAFDARGYYRTGDAVRWLDPEAPKRGLVFDGRIAEDFKLSTGTWVHAGQLRLDVLEATAGLLREVVVVGPNRPWVGLLAWADGPVAREALAAALRAYNARVTGSARRVRRVLLLDAPPSIDADEITDKGYVHQAEVRRRRAEAVDRLYAAAPDGEVLLV